MAGHSKFKNIMHRKGAQDKKRAKMFTKVGREIIVAAKLGGGDPDANPRLRLAISSARAVNMPNDRIKRAIETATGDANGENYEDIRYEGYGQNGVALIVEALTDNRNRTAAEMRTLFNKGGGSLGETNSVSFQFDRIGEIIYPIDTASADAMFEAAVEAGADNVESDDENHVIVTAADDLSSVRDSLEGRFGEAQKAALSWQANVTVPVDFETAKSMMALIESLEDSDDVQNVYSNMDIPDDVLAQLDADET